MTKTISARLAALRAKQNPHLATASTARRSAKSAPIGKARPIAKAARRPSTESASARVRAVIASTAYQGREAQAEALLLASCEAAARLKTSSEIISELSRRPTDADIAKARAEREQKAAADGWSKAVEHANSLAGHDAGRAANKTDPHGWAKAVALANGGR